MEGLVQRALQPEHPGAVLEPDQCGGDPLGLEVELLHEPGRNVESGQRRAALPAAQLRGGLQAARQALREDGLIYLEAPRIWSADELAQLGLQVHRQGKAGVAESPCGQAKPGDRPAAPSP